MWKAGFFGKREDKGSSCLELASFIVLTFLLVFILGSVIINQFS